MVKKKDLAVVSVATFHEGMYIQSEIYYQYEKSYVLLCKDVVLTPDLIHKLHQSEDSNQSIYVRKTDLGRVLRESQAFIRRKEREERERRAKESMAPADPEPPPAPEGSGSGEPSRCTADPLLKPKPRLTSLQKELHAQRDYQEINRQAAALIDAVSQTSRIPIRLTDELTRSVDDRLKTAEIAALIQCINSLCKMDDFLYTHSTNVAILNGLIGRWLGLPEDAVIKLIRTGLLHDLGKLRIPPAIIQKPGALTAEELEAVRKHAADSCAVMAESGETDELVLQGVRGHHERMNGAGYPDALRGRHIPLFARITAVSDVYDAMVAERPYKGRSSPFAVLSEFDISRFSNLDMRIVSVFLRNLPGELVGKRVLLSDGRVARVVYTSQSNLAYPIVRVGGKLIETDASLHCVAMYDFVSLFPG